MAFDGFFEEDRWLLSLRRISRFFEPLMMLILLFLPDYRASLMVSFFASIDDSSTSCLAFTGSTKRMLPRLKVDFEPTKPGFYR